MGALSGRIAVVAGASRGAGKGIALALGEAGATVYAVGRTSIDGPKHSSRRPEGPDQAAVESFLEGATPSHRKHVEAL